MDKVTINDIADPIVLKIFGIDFNMYGTVDRPLFLAIDVAEMIEYSTDKVGQMLELVDDCEKLTDTIHRAGEKREMWFLTENGLYELLMQSRKPLARQFKDQVKDILRQIRTGELRQPKTIVRDNTIIIENSKFIFETNFSGDPKRDRFNSDQRRGNLIIPNPELALDLRDRGFNVKETKPRPGEEEGFFPTYFVVVKLNYDSQLPPKIFLVNDTCDGVLLDGEAVCRIDTMWIDRVNAVLNVYEGPNGKSLYVKSMEVFQKMDDDPIASRHRKELQS